MKKFNTARTVAYLELNGQLLKIGSAPLKVWEDFSNLSPEHNPESIAENSLINFAQITRDALKLTLKHYNPEIDIDKLHETLGELTENQLIEMWSMITDIDKHLFVNEDSYVDLTNEEIADLKKKKSL